MNESTGFKIAYVPWLVLMLSPFPIISHGTTRRLGDALIYCWKVATLNPIESARGLLLAAITLLFGVMAWCAIAETYKNVLAGDES